MNLGNGGPAFPTMKSWDENFCDEAGYARTRRLSGAVGGMTLRDYFIAHAPAEPWPEFEPAMPPVPQVPPAFGRLSETDRHRWNDEGADADDLTLSPELRAFALEYSKANVDRDEWYAKKKIERRTQWPAYWADQMLKARTE